jgi:hypothetical protein
MLPPVPVVGNVPSTTAFKLHRHVLYFVEVVAVATVPVVVAVVAIRIATMLNRLL